MKQCETCNKDLPGISYATSSSIKKILASDKHEIPQSLRQCKECAERDFELACTLVTRKGMVSKEVFDDAQAKHTRKVNELENRLKCYIKLFGNIYIKIS